MSDVKLARVSQLLDEHDKREADTATHNLPLLEFRSAVEAAIPGCRTTRRGQNWAWVYMPEDHYAMGAVGYGNFSQNGRGGSTYAVRSNNITNNKYATGSKQRRMVMSKASLVAVKNAKTYLRKLSPQDLVKHTHEYVRDAIKDMRSNARSIVMKQEVELFGASLYGRKQSPVVVELKLLMERGHTFHNASMSDQLREYFALMGEDDDTQQPYNMLFVSVTRSGNKQRFDIVPVDKADHHWATPGDAETYYDNAPEHVLGRLAVLSMVENGTFVPGVGLKHTEGLFYVAR